MCGSLRVCCLVAAVILSLILPVGEASVVLVLFVACVLGAAALMLRSEAPEPRLVAALGGDMATTALFRRTRPELRMHRPAKTVEAQIRWRQESERRRRRREMFEDRAYDGL
ncbi:MAG: hypothetical protein WB697_05675 [Stellaceae bacterium]